MRSAKTFFACLALLGTTGVAAAPAMAGSGPSYIVELNKTEIVRLPGSASSIIVGNPKIADVTVQATDLIFVVGRGYGETNLVILDENGQTMMDADIQVVNTLPTHGVRIYNGGERETYSCIPYCGPSPVLGDNPNFVQRNTSRERQIDPFTAFLSSLSASASQAGNAQAQNNGLEGGITSPVQPRN